MTTTFEDLAQFGISDRSVDELLTELNATLAEAGINSEDELEHALRSSDFLSSDLTATEYIAQWGVLGMKWGKRKNRDGKYEVNPARQAGNHPGHGEGGDKLDVTKKAPSQMSNDELAGVIRRIQLEQQYYSLTAPKKSPMLAATQKILADAVKKQASAYASEYLGIAVAAALKKAKVPRAAELAAAAAKAASEKKDSDKKKDS